MCIVLLYWGIIYTPICANKDDYYYYYYYNNIEIERVTQFNFLGVIISSNIKWNGHVTHISQKISRIVGIMYRLKHIYPQAVLLTLYSALIVPHLTYYLLACGSKIVPNHPLHLLQKKALRIFASQDYISHTEPICKEYRILKIFELLSY